MPILFKIVMSRGKPSKTFMNNVLYKHLTLGGQSRPVISDHLTENSDDLVALLTKSSWGQHIRRRFYWSIVFGACAMLISGI
jgi:hypothetical protein